MKWAHLFDLLIEAGHSHRDIPGYTWAQFTAYLRAANRRKAEARRFQLMANALGFGGGDGLKSALQALEGDDDD